MSPTTRQMQYANAYPEKPDGYSLMHALEVEESGGWHHMPGFSGEDLNGSLFC